MNNRGMGRLPQRLALSGVGLSLALLAGCTGMMSGSSESVSPGSPVMAGGSGSMSMAAGGTHTVQQGDTLYSIASRNGLAWQELARINGIEAPFTIRIGQVLTLGAGAVAPVQPVAQVSSMPPVVAPATSYPAVPAPVYQTTPAPVYQGGAAPVYQAVPAPVYQGTPAPAYQNAPAPAYQSAPQYSAPTASAPVYQPAAQMQPVAPVTAPPVAGTGVQPVVQPAGGFAPAYQPATAPVVQPWGNAAASQPVVQPAAAAVVQPAASVNNVPQQAAMPPVSAQSVTLGPVKSWQWPTRGKVIETFAPSRATNPNKGIDIAGQVGQPVVAAAAGEVVYAGSGLQGYGQLLLIRHNSTWVTAYGHNQRLLVQEGQMVSAGQKIAEMGSTGTDRVKLHFELRKDGKPVDPLQVLPRG